MRIILASSSPRRKEILSRLNTDFDIIHPDIIEPEYNEWCKPKYNRFRNAYDWEISPESYSEHLSKMKAESIFKNNGNHIVIGADTIVVLENLVLGKPKNKNDAYETLMMLSGKTHTVITGVTIIKNEIRHNHVLHNHSFHEKTLVKFFKLKEIEILKYINTDSPYDKAGSYGIQDYSSIFVERINGCYDNVLGFPLSRFNYMCKNTLNIPI